MPICDTDEKIPLTETLTLADCVILRKYNVNLTETEIQFIFCLLWL